MNNGKNDFGVSFSLISWVDGFLKTHPNTAHSERSDDIFFLVQRKRGGIVRLICINDYTCGFTRVLEVLEAFPQCNCIFIGGGWNGYTDTAKEFCVDREIGLFNSTEIYGVLSVNDHWKYFKRDEKGNPAYPFK